LWYGLIIFEKRTFSFACIKRERGLSCAFGGDQKKTELAWKFAGKCENCAEIKRYEQKYLPEPQSQIFLEKNRLSGQNQRTVGFFVWIMM